MFDKILFAKIGWAPKYEGEPCTGDFGEPNETGSWYERFNFLPGPGGRYYGQIPPMGPRESPPNPTEKSGRLVIFVSRRGNGEPLLPVGWEEYGSAYKIYRLFQFGTGPKLYRLADPLASVLHLESKLYSTIAQQRQQPTSHAKKALSNLSQPESAQCKGTQG